MIRGLAAAVALAAIGLAGCGGGDEPTRDDVRTVRDLLTSSANVQRAVGPILACAPEDRGCYQRVGREMIPVLEREQASFADVLEDTDNDCLVEAGGIYQDALAAFEEAGRAAAAGDTTAADTAIERTSPLGTAYVRKLSECGFSQGKMAEIQHQLGNVNIQILALVDKMSTCTDRKCVVSVSRQLESAAQGGVKAIDAAVTQIPAGSPSCLADSLDLARQSFFALGETAKALQEGRLNAAEQLGTHSDELGAQAQQKLAACLTTALSMDSG
jgi:hypothetical protein